MLPPQKTDKAEQARVKETYKQMVRLFHLNPTITIQSLLGQTRNLPHISYTPTFSILPLNLPRTPRLREEDYALPQPSRCTFQGTARCPSTESARRHARSQTAARTLGLGSFCAA